MLWNFYKDGITQSFINSWLLCRGQCYLNYCKGLTPIKLSEGLTFGLKGHKVLQEAYLKGKPLSSEEIQCILMDEMVLPLSKTIDEEMAEQLRNEILKELLSLYFKLHFTDFDNQHYWQDVEKRFKVPIDITSEDHVHLNGQWDGVNVINDEVELMDHKHYKEINKEEIEDELPFDPQVNIYLIAAQQHYGKFPKRIIYNILRRPGQIFGKKDTIQSYLERVVKDIKERPSHYYIRINYRPTQDELADWKRRFLVPIARDIKHWYDRGCPYYFNPTALVTKYGRSMYYNYIMNLPIENMYNLRTRNVVFSELDE